MSFDRYILEVSPHDSLVLSSYGLCHSPNAAISMIPIVSGMVLAMVYGTYLVWSARRIPTEFSESRYVGASMVLILEAFVMGVPVMVLSH
jgi:hypothetical protein